MKGQPSDTPWTSELIGRLRALWDEGHSTAEIGRRLGVGKNAVVSKAHRLDLPARPSPIIRDGAPRPPQTKRVRGPTLPKLMSLGQHVPTPTPPSRQFQRVVNRLARMTAEVVAPKPTAAPPPATVAPPPRAIVPSRLQDAIPCCFPIGEPRTPGFRYCDADALPGKPYCEPHAQVAYVKVRDRREAVE